MKLNLDRCDVPHSMIERTPDGPRLVGRDCGMKVVYLDNSATWVCAKCATDTLTPGSDWTGIRITDFHMLKEGQFNLCGHCGEVT